MGKYENIGDEAAKKTNQELVGEIDDLVNADLSSLFPDQQDKEVIDELIEVVNKSTDRNEMITACQAIALKLTIEGKKVFQDGFKIAKELAI